MTKPDLTAYRTRMDKAVQALKEEFAGLRTGRASAGLLEPVQVEAYGSTMPLNAVGAISVPEPRMITVSVWDKGTVAAVEKAIRSAGLGLNPVTDGTTVRVPIPPPGSSPQSRNCSTWTSPVWRPPSVARVAIMPR